MITIFSAPELPSKRNIIANAVNDIGKEWCSDTKIPVISLICSHVIGPQYFSSTKPSLQGLLASIALEPHNWKDWKNLNIPFPCIDSRDVAQ